jgi:hypothetical protein
MTLSIIADGLGRISALALPRTPGPARLAECKRVQRVRDADALAASARPLFVSEYTESQSLGDFAPLTPGFASSSIRVSD